MTLEHVKKYVNTNLDIDIESKKRTTKHVNARAIYYMLVSKYVKDEVGRPISLNQMAKYIGYDHTTAVHSRNKRFDKIILKYPDCKRVFDNFKNIQRNSPLDDVRDKYRVLLNDYLDLHAECEKLKKNKITCSNELAELIDTINEDKIDMFITRAKPMIKMLNKAKFN